MANTVTVPTKPWYQSKLAIFGITLAIVAGSNLAFGWLNVHATPEQIAAIQNAYPDVVDIIKRLKAGESIFSLIGAIIGILIAVVRVFFTTALIPQSAKK